MPPADRSLGGQVFKVLRVTHSDLLLAPVDDALIVDASDIPITGDQWDPPDGDQLFTAETTTPWYRLCQIHMAFQNTHTSFRNLIRVCKEDLGLRPRAKHADRHDSRGR